jgi:hypothetical protein
MIIIDDKLVSDEIFEKKFVCDLNACKGGCCVAGDSGAPLEAEELGIIDDYYDDIKPFMRKEGIRAVEEQGRYLVDSDGDYVTPLVNGEECAFVTFTKEGIAKCSIEAAWEKGVIPFKKPISCHLYPIRVTPLKTGEALNYHNWSVCGAACSLGEQMGVQVYKFLREPLIRKYGSEFYEQLEAAEKVLKTQEKE